MTSRPANLLAGTGLFLYDSPSSGVEVAALFQNLIGRTAICEVMQGSPPRRKATMLSSSEFEMAAHRGTFWRQAVSMAFGVLSREFNTQA